MHWIIKLLLLIVAPAAVVAIYQTWFIPGQPPANVNAGYAAGRTFALAFLPLLFAMPWNFLRNRKQTTGSISPGSISTASILLAWVLIALAGFYSTKGLKYDIADRQTVPQLATAAVEYQGPGCDLTVTFPAAPTLTKLPVPSEQMSAERAELMLGDTLLRTECLHYPNQITVQLPAAEAGLKAFIDQQGFSNVIYLKEDQSNGTAVAARGDKDMGAGIYTYETVMIYRSQSMLTIVTASPAKLHPTAPAAAFRQSLRP